MTRLPNAELLLGAVALAIAAAYYAAASAIPVSLLDDVVGSGGLPRAYAIALAGLALAQIVRALALGRHRASPSRDGSGMVQRKTLGMLALGLGYGAVLPWLGYAGAIALLLAATAAYMGAGVTRQVVVIALCGAAFLWVLFVWLLGIPQPSGIWSSL